MFLFDEAARMYNQENPSVEKVEKVKEKEQFLFRDPAEYEKLSPEERKAQTEKMMGFWRNRMPGGAIQ